MNETSVLEFIEAPTEEPQQIPEIEHNVDICGVRSLGVWRKFQTAGRMLVAIPHSSFETGIMLNVAFLIHHDNRCGGEYVGHALGDLLKDVKPNREQLANARRLAFDNCRGVFYDPANQTQIYRCTALFLLPGNKARYIR